jgi:hypothetical protein
MLITSLVVFILLLLIALVLLLTNACSSERREPFPKPCLFHELVQCVMLQQVSANVALFVRDRNAFGA